jgi:hypothetical protein
VNRDKLIARLAQLLAGLQVPVSMSMPLGTADDPARELMADAGFGWKNVEDFERYLRKTLDGKDT